VGTQDNPFVEKPFNHAKFFDKLWSKKFYFVLSICFFLTLAFLAIHYIKPKFKVGTTLLLRDDKNASLGAENLIDGLELFSGRKNLDNEIGILKSFALVRKAVERSEMEVSYYTESYLKEVERYKEFPFIVEIDTNFAQAVGVKFYVEMLENNQFKLAVNSDKYELFDFGESSLVSKKKVNKPLVYSQIGTFGEHFQFDGLAGKIVLQSMSDFTLVPGEKLSFRLNDLNAVTEEYRKDLVIQPITAEASILSIQLEKACVEKELDFLDNLCVEFINSGLDEKNEMAINTIDFIDSELLNVKDSLVKSENSLENYKDQNQILDLQYLGQSNAEEIVELEEVFASESLKLKYYDYLLGTLNLGTSGEDLISPATMGVDDFSLNTMITDLRKLYQEQTKLDKLSSRNHPVSDVSFARIQNLKESIVSNVTGLKKASEIRMKEVNGRLSKTANESASIPGMQRQLVDMERQFSLNSAMYTYLLQKKSEAQIAKSANSADTRVLDEARLLDDKAVFPNRLMFLLLAFFLGAFIPFVYFIIKDLLDSTITDKVELEEVGISLLGIIGHNYLKNTIPLIQEPRAAISESIRLVKLNLQYIAPNRKSKVIGITSTVSGEGKTFCSVNLAASLAKSGARTVIIGTDLRKPKIHLSFNLSNDYGLSNFLISEDGIDNVIQPSGIENLDVIVSGPIPPNPFELIAQNKMLELIEDLKKRYDYVIVDSSPVGMVADYLSLLSSVDATVCILRHKYSKRSFLHELERLKSTNKLENIYLLLNDYRDPYSGAGYFSRSKYGSYYGYQERPVWWRRLFRIFKR
jgi:capsular exopolysaccharide synthesis family protein